MEAGAFCPLLQYMWSNKKGWEMKGKKQAGRHRYHTKLVPTGMKVKSAILFSIFWIVLSFPLFKNIPELVRTLQTGDTSRVMHYHYTLFSNIWSTIIGISTKNTCKDKPALCTLSSRAINNTWFFHERLGKIDHVLTLFFWLFKMIGRMKISKQYKF